MAALIVLSASMLTFETSRIGTAKQAIYIVFFIDIAAGFIHYATFSIYAKIGPLETGIFSFFISALSFAALYLIQEFKLETIFQ